MDIIARHKFEHDCFFLIYIIGQRIEVKSPRLVKWSSLVRCLQLVQWKYNNFCVEQFPLHIPLPWICSYYIIYDVTNRSCQWFHLVEYLFIFLKKCHFIVFFFSCHHNKILSLYIIFRLRISQFYFFDSLSHNSAAANIFSLVCLV